MRDVELVGQCVHQVFVVAGDGDDVLGVNAVVLKCGLCGLMDRLQWVMRTNFDDTKTDFDFGPLCVETVEISKRGWVTQVCRPVRLDLVECAKVGHEIGELVEIFECTFLLLIDIWDLRGS